MVNTETENRLAPLAWVGIIWGVIYSLCIFLAPTVLISFVAILSIRRGYFVALMTFIGVIIGAAAVYLWALFDVQGAHAVFTAIPGVDALSIESAASYLQEGKIRVPVSAVAAGTPIKVYMIAGAMTRTPLVYLASVTLIPIGVRMAIMTAIFYLIGQTIWNGWTYSKQIIGLILFWIIYFVIYFLAHALIN